MVKAGGRSASERSWSTRVAGALLISVGLANTVLGLLSLATDLVRLSPGAAGGLLVLGLATAGLGVLVWRGVRWALTVALAVFGLLLVVQVGDVAQEGTREGATPRLVVLCVLVVSLALARVAPRGSRTP